MAIAVLGPLGACATTKTQTTLLPTTVKRIEMPGVSAYLMVRGTEVALVDTGGVNQADAIEAALSEVGLGWDNVGHIILTHWHGDHVDGLGPIMGLATEAVAYAGSSDIELIRSPRSITPLFDGDSVFGLDILHTPGHTSGHISVHDPLGRTLIAGDALIGGPFAVVTVQGVALPYPQFTLDMEMAIASAEKMALLDFDTLYFAHGEPVLSDANAAVRALLATL